MVASKIKEDHYSYEFIGFGQKLIYEKGKLKLMDTVSNQVSKEFVGDLNLDFDNFEKVARDLYSDLVEEKVSY